MIKIKIYHDIQLSFGVSDVKRTVIKQNSEDTHVLRIKLYDKQNNEMTIGSNWDITISAVKGDKTHILNTNNISVANNTIQVTMTQQMLAVPGTEKCELIIQEGNQVLFSDTFLIYVEPNVQDGSFIESSDEYDSIVDTLDRIKGYEKESVTAKDHIITISNEVDALKENIEEAVSRTNELIAENEVIKENENDRVEAENIRISKETARQQSEIERGANEQERIANEEVRQTNEETRIQAENTRLDNEVGRNNAESLRASQEKQRVTSENERIINEQKRNQSESTREQNEEGRIQAETKRETAESTRVTEFTQIKSDAETEITKLQNVNVEVIEGQDSYQVKITDKNGTSNTSDNLLNKISIGTVDKGDYNESPSATITGEFGNQKLNLRLPTGNPFVISDTYSSISEMETDKENINLYDFVMINTGNVEDEDNGKLYMKDTNGMMFITDLSGVQGIQGVKGETGETPNITIGTVTTGSPGTQASATITGTKENPIINFVIPRGEKGTFNNVSASSIPYNDETDTKSVKDVVDSLQTAIDDLEIGGRNLLKGTNKTGVTYAYPTSGYADKKSWTTTIPLNGDTYTLSFWAKSTVDGDTLYVYFHNPSNVTSIKGSQGQTEKHVDGACAFTLSTTLTKYWVTYTIPKGGNSTRSVIIPRLFDNHGSGTITLQWEKLEEGNKATDWTPAPEDTEAEIQKVDNKLTTNLLKPTLGTATQNGVTCTNNGDGTYTLNGNSTGTVNLSLLKENTALDLPKGKLKILCTNDASRYYIASKIDGVNHYERSGEDIFDNSNGNVTFNYLYIQIPSGKTFDNDIVKPMLTTNLNATYDDFVPYTGSTGQINSDVAEVRKEVDSFTDTKNTAGSTDTSSKIFLVGATSQAANPQTYSDNQVYAQNGQLDANSVRVGEKVTLSYNSSTESLDFVFE